MKREDSSELKGKQSFNNQLHYSSNFSPPIFFHQQDILNRLKNPSCRVVLLLRYMEIPRLGVELERQLPVYTTATAM